MAKYEAVSKNYTADEIKRLRVFNCAALLAISAEYKPGQLDKSSGHTYHPNAQRAKLHEIKDDLRLYGLEETIDKWEWFTGLEAVK